MYPIGELFGRKIGLIVSGFILTFGCSISLISNNERGLGAIYAGRAATVCVISGVHRINQV